MDETHMNTTPTVPQFKKANGINVNTPAMHAYTEAEMEAIGSCNALPVVAEVTAKP